MRIFVSAFLLVIHLSAFLELQHWRRENSKHVVYRAYNFSAVLPAVAASARLDLFDTLASSDQGMSFDELTMKLGVSQKGLHMLLIVLTHFGLVSQDPVTKTLRCLPNGGLSSGDIAILISWMDSTQRQFYYLAESVKEGRAVGLTAVMGNYSSIYTARAANPDIGRYWDQWMDLDTREEEHQYKLGFVNQFGGKQYCDSCRILDWCGNTGRNAMWTSDVFPTSHVTMLDLPEQCKKADLAIKAAQKEHRIETLPADLARVDFSLGQRKFEMVYMFKTIPEWSHADLKRFFSILHESLVPGGSLIMDYVFPGQIGDFAIEDWEYLETFGWMYHLASTSHGNDAKVYHDIHSMLKSIGFEAVKYVDSELIVVATKRL